MAFPHVLLQGLRWLRVSLFTIVIFSLGEHQSLIAFNIADTPHENAYENSLCINEFMADNGSTLADEDGDYEDWIELHNVGDTAISLAGYGLSDKADAPFAWVFPDVEIQPGGFLLVWASGKDRTQAEQPLHANFKISAGGEAFYLTQPSGTLVDQIGPVSLRTDVSYGRSPDGAVDLRFFLEATPGAGNTTPGYTDFLSPPDFSLGGGFYTQPFSLTLTSSLADATILYTLDGSDPDPQNLNGQTYTYKQNYPQYAGDPVGEVLTNTFQTQIYAAPLSILDRSTEANKLSAISTTWHRSPEGHVPVQPVYKGTMVRARVVKEGALPSPIVTHTYFVSPDAPNRYALPVVSLAIQPDRLFDYNIGVYIAGVDFDNWRLANPNGVVNNVTPANYMRRSDTWEYPVHFEYFDALGQLAIAQNLGFRINGSWSRAFPQKSLRLYASDGYDERDVLAYPFFDDLKDKVDDKPISEFRRLILRNAGNDTHDARIRDPFVQKLMQPLGLDGQAHQSVILFINGEFWGHINLRERIDRYFIASHYGIDPDDVALLELNAALEEGVENDREDYLALRNYISTHDMSDPVHFAYAAERMDMDNYINYYVAEIYAGNVDWPNNNITYWRKHTPDTSPGAPAWHDGRWRWLLNDLDHGFALVNSMYHDTLLWATSEQAGQWATVMFRKLLENPAFAAQFINTMADHMNTTFQPANVEAVLALMRGPIDPYLPEHVQRWPDTINTSTERILQFSQVRPGVMRQSMIDYFGLSGTAQVTLNLPSPESGYVRLNSIVLEQNQATRAALPSTQTTWTGIYYQDVPIQVTAIARPGYRFVGWAELSGERSATLALQPVDGLTLTPLFELQTLLHYWNFNDAAQLLAPVVGAGLSSITLSDGGEIGCGCDAGFNGENARTGDAAGTHLYINAPLGVTMTVHAPTTGVEDVVIRYESRRSSEGAGIQEVAYTVDGKTYTLFDSFKVLDADPQIYTVDFSNVPAVDDNAEFALRITFAQGEGGTAGDNRFDNLTVEGSSRFFLPFVKR